MRLADFLLLLSLAAIWGASFLFMRVAVPHFGPVPLVALRMTLAGLALSPVFLRRRSRQLFRTHWWHLLVSGVVGTSIPFVLLSWATLTLTAGFTSLMNSSVPIFSALIAAAWLGERLRATQILGLALGITGVAVLVWGKLDFSHHGQGWPILACLTAGLCYGFGASWMKRHLQEVSPPVASAGSLLGAGLILAPLALAQLPATPPPPVSWFPATALALLCTALAFILFFNLIQRSGPTVATSVTFLIPFFGIFWGWLILDETITSQMLLGLLVTLLGTAFITGVLGRRKAVARVA